MVHRLGRRREGCSAGRLEEPDRDRGWEIGHDELAGSSVLSMQPLAVSVDLPELSSRLGAGDRRFHDSDRGVFEVGEIAALPEQAEHPLEDASNQRGWKVVEGESADDVIECSGKGSRLDRKLVKFDRQVRVMLAKWIKQTLFEHLAEERIDFDNMKFIFRANGLENLRREGAGPRTHFEDSLRAGRLAKGADHLIGELIAARPDRAGVSKVSKCLRKEIKHGKCSHRSEGSQNSEEIL